MKKISVWKLLLELTSFIVFVLSIFVIKYLAQGLYDKVYLTDSVLSQSGIIVRLVLWSIVALATLTYMVFVILRYLKERETKKAEQK